VTFTYPEGATPLDDLSGLKVPWVVTLDDLNQVEAENIARAANKHLLRARGLPRTWFQRAKLLQIHREMFCDVWEWAGKFRTTQTAPGIAPYQIGSSLEQLCQDVRAWCLDPVCYLNSGLIAIFGAYLATIAPWQGGKPLPASR
jgi:fido (protein-threonine AMPylation protein)